MLRQSRAKGNSAASRQWRITLGAVFISICWAIVVNGLLSFDFMGNLFYIFTK